MLSIIILKWLMFIIKTYLFSYFFKWNVFHHFSHLLWYSSKQRISKNPKMKILNFTKGNWYLEWVRRIKPKCLTKLTWNRIQTWFPEREYLISWSFWGEEHHIVIYCWFEDRISPIYFHLSTHIWEIEDD